MPRVTIEITDEALKVFRPAVFVRTLVTEGGTAVEHFASKVLRALDAGDEVVTFQSAAERRAAALGKNDSESQKA